MPEDTLEYVEDEDEDDADNIDNAAVEEEVDNNENDAVEEEVDDNNTVEEVYDADGNNDEKREEMKSFNFKEEMGMLCKWSGVQSRTQN